MTKMFEGGA